MGERPILFADEMVRAILDGRKTVTRRPVKSPAKSMQRAGMQVIKRREPGDAWYGDCVWSMRDRMGVWGDYTEEQFLALCPYGEPGDVLWVRECWGLHRYYDATDWLRGSVRGRSEDDLREEYTLEYRADSGYDACDGVYWRSAAHMPRWAARIFLRVTAVRVERLQDITEDDARAEGCVEIGGAWFPGEWHGFPGLAHARDAFAELWDGLAKPGTQWADNPCVWVIEFERMDASDA